MSFCWEMVNDDYELLSFLHLTDLGYDSLEDRLQDYRDLYRDDGDRAPGLGRLDDIDIDWEAIWNRDWDDDWDG